MYPIFKKTENPYSVFCNFTEEEICEEISKNPELFNQVIFKTKKICIAGVNANPVNIHFIEQPCEQVQILAVTLDPDTIMLIDNPVPEAKKIAVKADYILLSSLKDKTFMSQTKLGHFADGKVFNVWKKDYELVIIALKKAIEAQQEAMIFDSLHKLLDDVEFLKEYKRTINHDSIKKHLKDKVLDIYERIEVTENSND